MEQNQNLHYIHYKSSTCNHIALSRKRVLRIGLHVSPTRLVEKDVQRSGSKTQHLGSQGQASHFSMNTRASHSPFTYQYRGRPSGHKVLSQRVRTKVQGGKCFKSRVFQPTPWPVRTPITKQQRAVRSSSPSMEFGVTAQSSSQGSRPSPPKSASPPPSTSMVVPSASLPWRIMSISRALKSLIRLSASRS